MLNDVCAVRWQVVRETVDLIDETGRGRADASRLEAWTLSAALVARVLHCLLQLDANYFHVRFVLFDAVVRLEGFFCMLCHNRI